MKPRRIHWLYVLAVAWLAICSHAAAQTEELENLRAIYFEQIEKVSVPVEIQYGQSLVKLQKALLAENNLEEALTVKKEIERLKAKLAGDQEAAQAVSRARTSPAVEKPGKVDKMEKAESGETDQKFKWLGDYERERVGGEKVISMEADEAGDVSIVTELKNVQREYPDGAVWRFLYMSKDYTGTGMNIIFEFPGLRVLNRTGTAIRPNGNWIERTRAFPDFKGEDRVNFKLQLHKGSGGIYLKDISLRPMKTNASD